MTEYSAGKGVQKGAVEGGVAGSVATLLAFIMTGVRANNPDLPWGPEADVALVGGLTGLLTGVAKFFRNRRKNR